MYTLSKKKVKFLVTVMLLGRDCNMEKNRNYRKDCKKNNYPCLSPKIAVPMRTIVAPSSMAIS